MGLPVSEATDVGETQVTTSVWHGCIRSGNWLSFHFFLLFLGLLVLAKLNDFERAIRMLWSGRARDVNEVVSYLMMRRGL